ncbi:pseudouridine synthase family protein, partial [Staphylococcus epidermidis]|uniref:tRNA pseudouridine(55) synthase TruB n=1 Tax=Staphylococcus epidermidis TaxID=1282 RepID=UPI0011A6F8F9
MKKIGHTPTLHPQLNPVLPISLPHPTKLTHYIIEIPKTYHPMITLPNTTTTQHQTPHILQTTPLHNNHINQHTIHQLLHQFQPHIQQIPPIYSSLKLNPTKLYQYPTNNQTLQPPKPQVFIKHIHTISQLTFQHHTSHFQLQLTSPKPTYITTLPTHIRLKLPFPPHISPLTTIPSPPFQLQTSLTIHQIKQLHQHHSLHNQFFPIQYPLKPLKSFQLKHSNFKKKICNPQKF